MRAGFPPLREASPPNPFLVWSVLFHVVSMFLSVFLLPEDFSHFSFVNDIVPQVQFSRIGTDGNCPFSPAVVDVSSPFPSVQTACGFPFF